MGEWNRRRSDAFGLTETIVTIGLVAVVAAGLVPVVHVANAAPRQAARRDAALRIARNALVRARAATAYDAAAVAALSSAPAASWTLPVRDPRTGSASTARISTSASGGSLTVTVALDGETVALSEPLRVEAPAPNAVLDPAGY